MMNNEDRNLAKGPNLRKDYLEQIKKELASAQNALSVGNDGKARVCARRAAGQAITWYLTKFPEKKFGNDAVTQLRFLMNETSFPQEVRDAAVRLTTKISERFTYPFSTDPIEDAHVIIRCIESIMNSNAD